jgi:hypothetical protein
VPISSVAHIDNHRSSVQIAENPQSCAQSGPSESDCWSVSDSELFHQNSAARTAGSGRMKMKQQGKGTQKTKGEKKTHRNERQVGMGCPKLFDLIPGRNLSEL